MEKDYWHNRWKNNDIGFHEADGNPFLKKHVGFLKQTLPARIFVPLCGKTKDIGYLLQQGCEVVAIELNEMAVIQLFEELNKIPTIETQGALKVYSSPGINVFVGDIFDVTADLLGSVSATYDRAAVVALPDEMRKAYAKLVTQITKNAPQLVLTFSYDQSELSGPPFNISEPQLSQLYSHHYSLELIDKTQVPGGLKGLVPAECLVFSLLPNSSKKS